jgi:hypothetical protein
MIAGHADAAPVHSVSWVQTSVSLGTPVPIAGRDFVLVRMPVADFGSSTRYVVEFLADAVPATDPPQFFAMLQTEHSNQSLVENGHNQLLTISGFPAAVQVSDGRIVDFSTDQFSGLNFTSVDANAIGLVQIKVGSTVAVLYVSFTAVQQAEKQTKEDAPYSASANANWNSMTDPTALVSAVDKWIDYIRVVQVN